MGANFLSREGAAEQGDLVNSSDPLAVFALGARLEATDDLKAITLTTSSREQALQAELSLWLEKK